MTKKLKIALISLVLTGNFTFSFADIWSVGMFGEGKNSEAIILHEEACKKQNFQSCNTVGTIYENGNGIDKDNKKARYFYAIACNNDNSDGCKNLELMKKQETYSKHFKQAREYCNTGNALACGDVGSMYYEGLGVSQDIGLASIFFKKACDEGNMNSCRWLGNLYYHGKGIEKNYFIAFESFKKDCDAGNASSCLYAGSLYKNGQGTRLDIEKAIDYYGKACDLHDEQGCESYKRLKSPQPVNNTSNSNYQQEQLKIQQKQLKLLRSLESDIELNSMQQQNQLMNMQNAQYLRNLGY